MRDGQSVTHGLPTSRLTDQLPRGHASVAAADEETAHFITTASSIGHLLIHQKSTTSASPGNSKKRGLSHEYAL